jgi:hypothetical protein
LWRRLRPKLGCGAKERRRNREVYMMYRYEGKSNDRALY